MVKKLVTIDVQDKELKKTTKSVKSAKSVSAKKTSAVQKKEVENFGIVEINNASSAKKVKNKVEKGFEKNVSSAVKKTVKAQTSKVDDYFDFSFRVSEPVVESAKVEDKIEVSQAEVVSEVVKFDSEAAQIIRVARIGSLFDCDKRMINA